MNQQIVTQQLALIMTLALKQHWGVRVMEQKGMITAPVYMDNFWYAPIYKPDSTIPAEPLRRVDMILRSGVRPQGMIIGYELPVEAPVKKEINWEPLIDPRNKPVVRPKTMPVRRPSIAPSPFRRLEVAPIRITQQDVEIALKVLTGVAVVAGLATLTALAIAAQALAMVDPVLIMVLSKEEGEPWVCVARWFD
jgi:hypothetical protein